MKIEVNIPDQDIIDALIGAFEGGSNYWYELRDLSMVPKIEGKAMSERIIIAALAGQVIPVHDLENELEDECLGHISKENIERGVKLYIEEYGDIQVDEMDASDSDVLLQFIVMGEIIFG